MSMARIYAEAGIAVGPSARRNANKGDILYAANGGGKTDLEVRADAIKHHVAVAPAQPLPSTPTPEKAMENKLDVDLLEETILNKANTALINLQLENSAMAMYRVIPSAVTRIAEKTAVEKNPVYKAFVKELLGDSEVLPVSLFLKHVIMNNYVYDAATKEGKTTVNWKDVKTFIGLQGYDDEYFETNGGSHASAASGLIKDCIDELYDNDVEFEGLDGRHNVFITRDRENQTTLIEWKPYKAAK